MYFADDPAGITFFNGATAVATSAVYTPGRPAYFFKASGLTTAGAGTAKCRIYGRDIPSQAWFLLLDIQLTLSTTIAQEAGSSTTVSTRFASIYADLYELTGTGASFTMTMVGGS